MSTRRFKFLDRKKILQEHLKIRLEQQGRVKRFTADLDLAGYGFPQHAEVVVEAKTLLETMRFKFGTIGGGLARATKDVSRLQSERITFNVLVLDPQTSRKFGSAETVRPIKSDNEGAGSESLLPVVLADDLEGPLWLIRYADDDGAGHSDAPILVFSRAAANGSAAVFVQEAAVRAMVMPAAFQEILTHILLSDEHDYEPEGEGWRDAWIRLASSLVGEDPPLDERRSRSDVQEWIASAACALARRADLLGAYLQEAKQ